MNEWMAVKSNGLIWPRITLRVKVKYYLRTKLHLLLIILKKINYLSIFFSEQCLDTLLEEKTMKIETNYTEYLFYLYHLHPRTNRKVGLRSIRKLSDEV
jgi:hypothetical protein